jgi:hypothetical protein
MGFGMHTQGVEARFGRQRKRLIRIHQRDRTRLRRHASGEKGQRNASGKGNATVDQHDRIQNVVPSKSTDI